MRTIIITCFAWLAIFSGCHQQKDLEGFDEEKWKSDGQGCLGHRSEMIEAVRNVKQKLKGMSQEGIQAVLGKPTRHELYRRNQKFFIYQVGPGAQCQNGSANATILEIRFDALGRADEIVFQNL